MPTTSHSKTENVRVKDLGEREHGHRDVQDREEKKGKEKVSGPTHLWKKRRCFLEPFTGWAGLTTAAQNSATGKVEILSPGELKNKDGKSDLPNDHGLSLTAKEADERISWSHGAPPHHTFTFAKRTDMHGKVPILRDPDRSEGWGQPEAEEANALEERTAAPAE